MGVGVWARENSFSLPLVWVCGVGTGGVVARGERPGAREAYSYSYSTSGRGRGAGGRGVAADRLL